MFNGFQQGFVVNARGEPLFMVYLRLGQAGSNLKPRIQTKHMTFSFKNGVLGRHFVWFRNIDWLVLRLLELLCFACTHSEGGSWKAQVVLLFKCLGDSSETHGKTVMHY